MRREVFLTSKALSDVDKLRFAIVFKYRAPLTAKRYLKGLNDTIQSLKIGADSIQIESELSTQYGFDIRRINFKEMAIAQTFLFRLTCDQDEPEPRPSRE